jgi:2,3-bisphosphoglycerate-independent phosphoglycerate mutase
MSETFRHKNDLEILQKLVKKSDSKIVLLVMDGLGGLPSHEGGLTELETAKTPHMDALAERGICGLHTLGPGITPGSGAAHLGLFGYDPFFFQVGRGVLAALGIDFDLNHGDLAARGNFCTLDNEGRVSDRRAGRISTEKCQELCGLLKEIELPDTEIFIQPVQDYRFLLVLRGDGLSDAVSDTDPQDVGKKPLRPKALTEDARKAVELVEQFVDQAREILKDEDPANMVLLRGFSMKPDWPTMPTVFGLDPAVIAGYPMYRGVAKLVGMKVLETGLELDQVFHTLEDHWQKYDFFFLHFKPIDSAGEDGDFDRKVKLIEQVDGYIPRLLDLNPDVVILTGDHSTPSVMKGHGWQPVPIVLWSRYCRPDDVKIFGERACLQGGLGPQLPVTQILPIALANARRLSKFGA